MDANTNASSAVQSKILGNLCIPTTTITVNPNATTIQQDNNNLAEGHQINQESLDVHSDTENFDNCDDQLDILSNDEQSSEPSNDALPTTRNKSYSTQRVNFASPKSSSENNLEDRRLRRQIANCNERRRMQSINAGFQALRQFLPQRCGEKLSKAAILQQTAELIQTLQLDRRPSDQCKPTSDEEANAEADRPQCKKRRITIKNEQKHSPELKQEQSGHLESRIHDYIKIIEGLREELTKEQQLRLLYEQRFTDLKTTLSASFGSLPNGMNLDHNENTQQQPNLHQRSSSADDLLVPKSVCDTTSALLLSNLAAVTEASFNYNNQMRMTRPHQSNSAVVSALLSPNQTQQLSALAFGGASSFAQQPIQSMLPLVNYLTASLQTPQQIPLNQTPNAGIQSNGLPPAFYAIAEALRQIENDNSKIDNLPIDVR